MTDNWDFYFVRVDDKPASMFVDLGAIEFAPVAALPHMAYVRLYMREPRDDGLSSQAEYDTLSALEDHLAAQLADDDTAFVGRCTTNGCRDFFFYVADPASWTTRVAAAMQAYANYRFEADTRTEPDWACYFQYLYPSEADRQSIENRRVCEALQRNGDPLTASREIDHWIYFDADAARGAFIDAATRLGYALRGLHTTEEQPPRYVAQLWRVDVPSFNNIDDVTAPLFELARQHQGDYDGWECPVIN